MTNSMEQVRSSVITRFEHIMSARAGLATAMAAIETAGGEIEQAWKGWGHSEEMERHYRRVKCEGFDALHLLTEREEERHKEDALACVAQIAHFLSLDLIEVARKSGDNAVVSVTGNSYMPPLRSFADAEIVWVNDHEGILWEHLVETLESKLDQARVYLGSPDFDNFLYVVDLARFEAIDDPDHEPDSLNDEWTPIDIPF